MAELTARLTMARPAVAAWIAGGLAALLATSAAAAWLDAPWLLPAVAVAIAVLAVAILEPTLLLYLYCAAIPFNFALPPGPAGTVARIVGLVFVVGYLLRRPDALRPQVIPVAGWLFVAWSLASVVWSLDPNLAFATWSSLVQLFAITVLIASLVAARAGIVRVALRSYAVAASVTAAVGVLAYLQGTGIFSRATAFADQDPALFSSIVLPAVIVLMGEVQAREGRPAVRVAALAALVVCVIALVLSGTRSAWVGLGVAVAAWLILKRDRRLILALGALVAGLAVVMVAVPEAEDLVSQRLASSLATGGAGRTDIWAVGVGILASTPVVGVGFANFGEAFTPDAIAQAAVSLSSGELTADLGPHNIFLGTVVETGIIGGVLLAVLLVRALAPAGAGRIGTIVRIALIGLLVQSFFLDILLQKQLWLFLGLAFGLAFAPERIGGRPAGQAPRWLDGIDGRASPAGWP